MPNYKITLKNYLEMPVTFSCDYFTVKLPGVGTTSIEKFRTDEDRFIVAVTPDNGSALNDSNCTSVDTYHSDVLVSPKPGSTKPHWNVKITYDPIASSGGAQAGSSDGDNPEEATTTVKVTGDEG